MLFQTHMTFLSSVKHKRKSFDECLCSSIVMLNVSYWPGLKLCILTFLKVNVRQNTFFYWFIKDFGSLKKYIFLLLVLTTYWKWSLRVHSHFAIQTVQACFPGCLTSVSAHLDTFPSPFCTHLVYKWDPWSL